MIVSAETFERLALEDEESQWEMVGGRIRRKPGMSYLHNHAGMELAFRLQCQLPIDELTFRVNAGYLKRGDKNYFRPDVMLRTIIAWRRQADGTYSETIYTTGAVPVQSLPGVSVVLESLFR